ncbi:MAG: DUF1722 domain-containing protein [Vicinamibacterales bacterium]
MRIWDVSPGYLNRQSLLGEHRELHGLYNILVLGKTGYSRHPETLRWVGCVSGLVRRHALLVAEMHLRTYRDRTPLAVTANELRWPGSFVTSTVNQFLLLAAKYQAKDGGRLALPRNVQSLWAQHKYSVLARDPALYREIGRRVAGARRTASLAGLAEELTQTLREPPSDRFLLTAAEHMWGYVAKHASGAERADARTSTARLMGVTRDVATRVKEPYLLASTALSELAGWGMVAAGVPARGADVDWRLLPASPHRSRQRCSS